MPNHYHMLVQTPDAYDWSSHKGYLSDAKGFRKYQYTVSISFYLAPTLLRGNEVDPNESGADSPLILNFLSLKSRICYGCFTVKAHLAIFDQHRDG